MAFVPVVEKPVLTELSSLHRDKQEVFGYAVMYDDDG